MLINADHSLLLLIDLQERLAPAIQDIDTVLRHNLWLVAVAQRLSVPVGATVQYPAGLGPMVPELGTSVPPDRVVEKIHFSAVADGCLERLPDFSRRQIVLTGTEAHVCVLQTALGLDPDDEQFPAAVAAAASRRASDKDLALARLRQEGCRIVSREMVAFEWLHKAGTDVFKQISREFLR